MTTATMVRIPRVIHRIWFGGPLPARERAFGETWQRHHPDWQLRLWQEKDVPPLINQAAFDAATTAAQKADIFRYELLLTQGGVCVDTDFECFRNIEDLLGDVEAFTAREDGFGVNVALLGCVPGHPFFAAVVAALPDSLAWRSGRGPNEQTGQEFLTKVLAEQDALGHEVPAVFGPELFYPYHWTEPHRAGEPFPEAYAAYHWAKSWHRPASQDSEPPPEAVHGNKRIVVTVDPDLVESAAVVLSGALEVASAVPGVELALVIKGVPEVTQAVGDAIAGVMQQLVGDRPMPDIVVYGEPEGAALPSAVQVTLSADPAENARSLLSLALANGPAAAPAPAAEPPSTTPNSVYVGNGRLLVRTIRGDKLYCSGDDLTVTPGLVLDGVVDRSLCTFVGGWLRPGDTAVDAGAGIGALTVVMARTVGRQGNVVAYAGTDEALLRDNITVNGFDDWVDVRPGPGPSPLDPALQTLKPRLVRIDAAGAEPDILAGMGQWLADARDVAIAVKVVRHAMGDGWSRFAEQLADLVAQGWQIAVAGPDGTAAGVDLSLILEVGRFNNALLIR